ncbi:hypothetical protein ACLKA7_005322 [Drosophila subpalustris]
MLPPIAAVTGNNLLQPISVTSNSNTSNNNNNRNTNGSTTINSQPTNVGATWSGNLKAGNLNIDLDNLLLGKAGKSNAPAPSMNALKTQSPAKSPLNVQTGGGGGAAFAGLSPLTSPNYQTTNIPAAFANFSAFQQQQPQRPHHSSNNNNASDFDIFQ